MTVRSAPYRSICIVATIPMPPLTVFMGPHIRFLMKQQYDVTVITNGISEAQVYNLGGVQYVNIRIARKISLYSDLMTVITLWRLFLKRRYDIVHSITPKAGLLSMIAGCAAGIPVRIHWFTGQVWSSRAGFGRWFLKSIDRFLSACATHLLADSVSQRDFLVQEGVVRKNQVTVLGHGSVCGVDIERFRPNRDAHAKIRNELGISDTAVVALYLGRLNKDKGLRELAEAFIIAANACPDLYLLIVGPDEDGMKCYLTKALSQVSGRSTFLNITETPELYMAAADLFVLPSYREGFGSTVVEAAACGIPAIGTRINGLADAIIDGVTGILVPPGDTKELAAALIKFAKDPVCRIKIGKNARERVEREFRQEILTAALWVFYENLFDSKTERWEAGAKE